MGCKGHKRLAFILALIFAASALSAQDSGQADSLVRLLKGKSVELMEKDGVNYRKAVEATFLHNGTYLICDTALWNVSLKIINCEGNVKLMQDETVLTSDKLDYFIDDNLAEFRGTTVQLTNKKDNILRTRNLDYNTKDSVAVFRGGGAMRDKDGQIVESDQGRYESVSRVFTFTDKVNMFTDSVFVKTSELLYESDSSMMRFRTQVDFWKEDSMLSADSGWYDKNRETFFFKDHVHGLSGDKETWSDSLYYYRTPGDVEMRGNVQVQDSTRDVAALSEYMYYLDSLDRITMLHDAAMALQTRQEEKLDTLYFGADSIVYETVRRCDIPEGEVKLAEARREEICADPVTEYRKRAAEEAAAAAKAALEQAAENDVNIANRLKAEQIAKEKAAARAAGPKGPAKPAPHDSKPSAPVLPPDNPAAPADSLMAPVDSLAAPVDSIIVPPDTSRVGFVVAVGRVKVFRKDMQVICDSLRYNDLDSIARFYKDPIVWNDTTRQYSSDSLFVLVRGDAVDRASLMSNAFIITKESEKYYDQIKGTDVMAFFDSDSELRRFDALGGATALFYLKEKEDKIATVNKVETKMLSALLKDGELERVFYFESPKNDAYPVVQLPDKDHTLKGFDWRPELRPQSRWDVTPLELKKSQREYYESRPHAVFKQTNIYFPGYIDKVYNDIEQSRERKQAARRARDEAARLRADSLAMASARADSLAAVADSSLAAMDSLAVTAAADTLAAALDSSAVAAADSVLKADVPELSEKEKLRLERKEARETARKLRIARRDAIWAEKDAKDAAKAEAKLQKQLDRKRERTKKLYIRQRRQDEKDAKKLQKYIERYERQKSKSSRERTPGA